MKLFIRNLMMQCAGLVACAMLLQNCSGAEVARALPPSPQEIVVVSTAPRQISASGRHSYRRGNYVVSNGHYRVSPGRKQLTRIPVHKRVLDSKNLEESVVS